MTSTRASAPITCADTSRSRNWLHTAILMRPWTTRLSVCRYNQQKIPHKNKRKNVGRRAVKHGPAGRQNRLHVDWKNGGFWLDCRFILTWHAAGRVGGCDDWRKEERKVANTSELQTRRFCVANVLLHRFGVNRRSAVLCLCFMPM